MTSRSTIWSLIVAVLSLQALVLSHAAQQNRTLVVTGHSGELTVVDMGGRLYVEIEPLARLVDASLGSQGNRMVLTLPASTEDRPASAPAPPPAPPMHQPVMTGFSKDFVKAGIEEMADIREWRSTLANAIQRGFPVTPEWVDSYNVRAQQSLALTSLAASTESDRAAFQLLTNEFNNMKQLSDRFLQANKSRTYISPDSLNNDPLDQKILKCARSLAAMAAAGQFADDGSCH
jgi:hypothetical protein